jgi:hypothetical protein
MGLALWKKVVVEVEKLAPEKVATVEVEKLKKVKGEVMNLPTELPTEAVKMMTNAIGVAEIRWVLGMTADGTVLLRAGCQLYRFYRAPGQSFYPDCSHPHPHHLL